MQTNLLRLLPATVALLTSCAGAKQYARSDADVAAVRQLYRDWPRSVEASDAARYVSFLDDSITLLIPGVAAVHGIAAYRAALTPLFQSATYRVSLTPPKLLEVTGSWAFAHYEGQITTLPRAGGEVSIARNRYVDILRRQPDGTWRVFLHSWQNDVPSDR